MPKKDYAYPKYTRESTVKGEIDMSQCGCASSGYGGPFSKGRELVEFVYNAHGGTVRSQPIRSGGLKNVCQGCRESFILETYVGACPHCGGVHAVAPMHPSVENIQFAGKGFTYSDMA